MNKAAGLSGIRAFLFDMDGTVFVSGTLIPGALELLEELDRRGWRYIFLTNNSSERAADYQARLARLGINTGVEKVLTSGEATVSHLREAARFKKVFLLGTPSLEAEFAEAGFELTDRDPDCVVLGFDKTITFRKLETAALLLARGLPYFATHPDYTCITDRGLIPDTGAFIAALEKVTHRLPKVIGKPEPEMVAAALGRLGARAEETAMVGDQLDTDMTMANRAGIFGVLVLSGETSRARLEAQTAVRPDLVLESVRQLLESVRRLSG